MILRFKKSKIAVLERAGAVVKRNKKKEATPKKDPPVTKETPIKKVEVATTTVTVPPKSSEAPPSNKEIVAAIKDLGEKLVETARDQPKRSPSPYKFILKRGKDRLLESVIAEPLAE